MRRILLTIEYYGKNFYGWQIQKNEKSVQGEITKAIKELTGEDVNLEGSGRTDSGVNAIGQTAHFDTESKTPAKAFIPALNNILKENVQIKNAVEVSLDFHARYSVKKKTYVYKMYVSKTASPIKDLSAMQINRDFINIEKMNQACEYLLGEQDFSSFKCARSAITNNIRIIYSACVLKNGEFIEFRICGNGFLHNMVRILAGTLIDVGTGKLKPEDMKTIITLKDRKKAGKTAKPHGLYLENVEY